MPAFTYRAVAKNDKIVKGRLDAPDTSNLAHKLQTLGLELIDAKQVFGYSFFGDLARPRAPLREIATLCSRIKNLLNAGISFPDALSTVCAGTKNAAITDALASIGTSISNGHGIAASFAMHSSLFKPDFTAVLNAGELSGRMPTALDYLCTALTDQANIQEKVLKSIRYPLFLFLIGGGAVVFMMTAVVPQIVLFLGDLGEKLPLSTRLLISFSAILSDYGPIIGAMMIIFVLSLCVSRKKYPSAKHIQDTNMLRLPVIGNIFLKTQTSKFLRSLSLLVQSGCSLTQSLNIAKQCVDNLSVREKIQMAELRLSQGESLSSAMKGVFPDYVIASLGIAEQSGNLVCCLDEVVRAYDREASASIDSFIGILEPGLTLLIGVILLWTVIAVMGPLYGSLSVLGARI